MMVARVQSLEVFLEPFSTEAVSSSHEGRGRDQFQIPKRSFRTSVYGQVSQASEYSHQCLMIY